MKYEQEDQVQRYFADDRIQQASGNKQIQEQLFYDEKPLFDDQSSMDTQKRNEMLIKKYIEPKN